jgi:hypothetical protein
MAATELACPKCGAPLKVEDRSAAVMSCPYCGSEVMLPEELRPPSPPVVEVVTFSSRRVESPPVEEKKRWPVGATLLFAILLIVIGGVIPTLISKRQAAALAARLEVEQTGTARAVFFEQTAAVTPTPEPTLTPTPQYANPVLTFGQKGIGEGMFTRASYIAVDGQGTLYVAEYEGGRVQRFDANGEYLSQWRFGDADTNLMGLAATRDGDVFLAYNGVIDRVNGTTGKRIQRLTHPEGGEFGDLAVSADGTLLSVWYEGRWGFITSLEGHREELDVFSPEGELIQATSNFISAQTEALSLDVFLAVNGKGTIYALSDSIIFEFSPEGKFIDRIDHLGDRPGLYSSAHALAVDGQDRVYVVDGRNVYVYEAGQRFVDVFSGPASLNALTIDRAGNLWGAADEQVIRFDLRP